MVNVRKYIYIYVHIPFMDGMVQVNVKSEKQNLHSQHGFTKHVSHAPSMKGRLMVVSNMLDFSENW